MKKTALVLVLLVCIAVVAGSHVFGGAEKLRKNASLYDRVGKDFIAGVSGDRPALDRAMKTCEGILAKEPDNAVAMAWQGAGWICLSGFEFRQGRHQAGYDLCQRGFARLDGAAALAPTDSEVLIIRGMSLTQCGLNSPRSKTADEWVEKGVNDMTTAVAKVGNEFATWPTDERGQILLTLADGLRCLGRTDQARVYYSRIVNEIPSTSYSEAARKHLQP